jgi:hypothetical protein
MSNQERGFVAYVFFLPLIILQPFSVFDHCSPGLNILMPLASSALVKTILG